MSTFELRLCKLCGKVAEFYRSTPSVCKTCHCARCKKWRDAHSEKVSEYAKRAAKRNGNTEVCSNCHNEKPISEFRTKLRQCKECQKLKHKKWLVANTNHLREYVRRKYAANPDEYRARSRKWNSAHPEKYKAWATRWRKNNLERANASIRLRRSRNPAKHNEETSAYKRANPDIRRKHEQNRRARKIGIGGNVTIEQWQEILMAWNNRCAYCRCGGRLTQDHVQPLYLGGAHLVDNIVPACRSCNCRKGRLTIDAFFAKERKYTNGIFIV